MTNVSHFVMALLSGIVASAITSYLDARAFQHNCVPSVTPPSVQRAPAPAPAPTPESSVVPASVKPHKQHLMV
jgi:hypothetical protein